MSPIKSDIIKLRIGTKLKNDLPTADHSVLSVLSVLCKMKVPCQTWVAASSWSSLFTLPAPASTFVVFGHPHEMLISLPGTGAGRLLWGCTWFTRPYQANLVGG